MSAPPLSALTDCFHGVVPAVVATASASGNPNIAYLSKVHRVDDEHVALSNQFFSKTSRNLAENPYASMVVVTPSYREYRFELRYVRTETRGPVFEGLAADVEALGSLAGMPAVFQLRAADIYRVLHVEELPSSRARPGDGDDGPTADSRRLGELAAQLGRAADLDCLLTVALDGLVRMGYENCSLMLLDELGERLFTIASRGYGGGTTDRGVGSELAVGEGLPGMAAARAQPMRTGNLGQMRKYSETVRRSFEEGSALEPDAHIPLPSLPDAQSQLAVPLLARGHLHGVLVVESRQYAAYTDHDEALLLMVAGLVAGALELAAAYERTGGFGPPADRGAPSGERDGPVIRVRYFPVDGSTFLGTDYLIKGVAGQVLWSLLRQYVDEGREEFTHREIRLDPSIDLPAFRDNLDSRLILLKRRLDERGAPIRIEKTGRGRLRLLVDAPVRLEKVGVDP